MIAVAKVGSAGKSGDREILRGIARDTENNCLGLMIADFSIHQAVACSHCVGNFAARPLLPASVLPDSREKSTM